MELKQRGEEKWWNEVMPATTLARDDDKGDGKQDGCEGDLGQGVEGDRNEATWF